MYSLRELFSNAHLLPVVLVSLLAFDANSTTLSEGETALKSMNETQVRSALHKELEPGVPYRLDLGNPLHYRYIMDAQARTGNSAERSPKLFELLKASHENRTKTLRTSGASLPAAQIIKPAEDDKLQDLNFISELSRSALLANGTAPLIETKALSSVAGGTSSTNVILTLFDAATGDIIDHTQEPQYGQGTNFVVSLEAKEVQPGTNVQSEAIFTYFPKNATDPDPVVVVQTTYSQGLVTDSCISAPNYCKRNAIGQCSGEGHENACTNKLADLSIPVKLCWFRQSAQECDYYTNTAHPQNYVFPLAGTVSYQGAVAQSNNRPSGTTTIYLQSTLGGGCYVHFAQGASLEGWTVTDKQSVKFDYDSAQFSNQSGCLTNNKNALVNLWALSQVLLQGNPSNPVPPMAALTFTSDPQQTGRPGVERIPQLYIMEGCVPAGTQITLANGKTAAIEDIKSGEKILTSNGVRTVLERTTGSETDALFEIKTHDAGKNSPGPTLVVTSNHPMQLENGEWLQANRLHVNDYLKGRQGKLQVRSARHIEKADNTPTPVFNLIVEVDKAEGDMFATYYANDLLTGDMNKQQQVAIRDLRTPTLSQSAQRNLVPAGWEKDYESQQQR